SELGRVTRTALREAELKLEKHDIDLDLARQKLKSLQSEDTYSTLEANVRSAELTLRRVEEGLGNLEVVSPLTGTVTSLSLVEGQDVRTGGIVGAVDNIQSLRIVAKVNEAAASLVRGKTELLYASA